MVIYHHKILKLSALLKHGDGNGVGVIQKTTSQTNFTNFEDIECSVSV